MEDNDQKTIEERIAAIEAILAKLEKPGVSLGESFELYKAGMTELQQASSTIEKTRKAVMAVSNNSIEPFENEDVTT